MFHRFQVTYSFLLLAQTSSTIYCLRSGVSHEVWSTRIQTDKIINNTLTDSCLSGKGGGLRMLGSL